jgi:predicted dehydrogenase
MRLHSTRREFLAGSAAVAVMPRPRARIVGANESVTLGFIGVGGMGSGLLNIFKEFDDVRVAAVCDVYEAHRLRAKDAAGGSPDALDDFRKVLDRNDIDAVVVATPDHWHAIPIIRACQAGKDVYGEKPLAYSIGEGRRIVDAVTKHKRITQMGNLIHATENYHRVAEIVQSGVLGRITKARFWMSRLPDGIGRPADTAPPEGCDYEFWLGPAPARPFNPNRFTFHWRWFWDYAGGLLCDFVCHLVDPILWGMNASAPVSVVANGGRYISEDNGETPDTMEVSWHYPDNGGWDLVWSQQSSNPHGFDGRGAGILFEGANGSLHAHYGDFKVISAKKGEELELPEPTLPRSPGHHREWINNIKTRELCSCNFDYGHKITSVGHLGNMALRSGERLSWNADRERVTNHPSANDLLFRAEYRKPWELPMA